LSDAVRYGTSAQTDGGGSWEPPLWIALLFCIAFAIATIVAAFLDQPAHIVGVLGGLFVVAFNRVFARDDRSLRTAIATLLKERSRS
jgi:membrane associated rhomboid family serine protease